MICLMLIGCTSVRKLDLLEKALYETKEVYVEMEKEEVLDYFSIDEKDFNDYIALQTLLVFNGKQIFVLNQKLNDYQKEKGSLSIIDEYTVYLSENDENLLNLITKYLNE